MALQKVINDLKQIVAECEKVTSGNVSYKITNIEHGILNIAHYLEKYCPLGWHPASELPKDEEEVIATGDYSTTRAVFHEGKYYIAEYYHNPESLNCALNGVKWWIHPPKEECL